MQSWKTRTGGAKRKQRHRDHSQGRVLVIRFTATWRIRDALHAKRYAGGWRNLCALASNTVRPDVPGGIRTGDNKMAKQQQSNNRRQSQNQNQKSASSRDSQKGDMSVREAGHKGGQRVRELVDEGKQNEGRGR
jgi:hypothetical protein